MRERGANVALVPIILLMKDAFTFPFRGGGKNMLIAGGVLGVTSDLASLAPLVGFQAVIFVGLVSFTPLFGASIFTENGAVFLRPS